MKQTLDSEISTNSESIFADWIISSLALRTHRGVPLVVNSDIKYGSEGDTHGEINAYFDDGLIKGSHINTAKYISPIFHGSEDGKFNPNDYIDSHLLAIIQEVNKKNSAVKHKLDNQKAYFAMSEKSLESIGKSA